MEITNAVQAREWLQAWGGRPRRGILAAAIDGLRMAESISRTYGRQEAAEGYAAAVKVLREA